MNKIRLFLCLPMTGRRHDDIIKDIDEMTDCVREVISRRLNIARYRVIVQHNYTPNHAPIGTKYQGCWYLQNSMKHMSYINALIFDPNWEYSNGCKIEKYVADIYKIPQIFLTYDSLGYHFPDEEICEKLFKQEDIK